SVVWLLTSLVCAHAGAASCSITSPTLNFGSYDPLAGTAKDNTAVLTVSCTRTVLPSEVVNYTLTSSIGNGPNYATRRMVSGIEILNYNVYRNAARTQIWGNGTGGSFVITGSFNLNNATPRNRNHTLFGRIPQLQDAAAGAYGDTLVVTLTF
ncbi:MAG: spore coat protein U domain-containing protein, partial [Hydrogenophilaceae bacterium]|nr:spore coat protein U domain-containing protein [Hydrogenophilaceae bacterium]